MSYNDMNSNKGNANMNNNWNNTKGNASMNYNNWNNKGNRSMSYDRFANLDVNNSAPRCPVILLLDTSYSMEGEPIKQLNAAVRQFLRETADDEAASMSVELEIIKFDDGAEVVMPFTQICDVKSYHDLTLGPCTSLGAGLTLAKKELKARRKLYQEAGISSYKPWLIVMTDGDPNDAWQQPADDMLKLSEKMGIMYLGIGLGDMANMELLGEIIPDTCRLQGLKFKAFFRWLTDSLKCVSSSTVAEEDNIQLPGIQSWADLSGM